MIEYGDWRVAVEVTSMNPRVVASLSYTGAYDEELAIPGQMVHFYDDGSVPTTSARKMDTYLGKLRTLMLLDGTSNSKPPLRYRLARLAGEAFAELGAPRLFSMLARFFQP